MHNIASELIKIARELIAEKFKYKRVESHKPPSDAYEVYVKNKLFAVIWEYPRRCQVKYVKVGGLHWYKNRKEFEQEANNLLVRG